MSRTLFLHVGCGKTGSSALQVWLLNNADSLSAHGVHYPAFGVNLLDAYAITSGNGVHLSQAVIKGQASEFLNTHLHSGKNTLFSSEAFQELTLDELRALKIAADQAGVLVKIVVYMRDVYDIAYSSYLQLVKRHGLAKTFREFSLAAKTQQQFVVVGKYESVFDNISALHYDTEKQQGLEKSFCRALDLNPADLPTMAATTVNRSLTLAESEMMRLANQYYLDVAGVPSFEFSRKISDALIYERPETKTSIFFDAVVLQHFKEKMGEHVAKINATYFPDKRLKIFSKENKDTQIRLPAIADEMRSMISILTKIAFPKVGTFEAAPTLIAPNSPLDAIQENQVVQYLFKSAQALETNDLPAARTLVRAAWTLRPDPQLRKKMTEYRAKAASAA
jgi:hypothetical protein